MALPAQLQRRWCRPSGCKARDLLDGVDVIWDGHCDGYPKYRRHRQVGREPFIPKDGTAAAEAALVASSFSFLNSNTQEQPSLSWTPTRTSAGTRTRGRTSACASGTSLLRHLLGGGAHCRGGSIPCLSRVPAIDRRNNSTATQTIGRRSTPWATSSIR